MNAPADAPARQSLVGNLVLSLAVFAGLAIAIEVACRLLEKPRPEVADYIWDWQRKWEGDFYTMRSVANGWPPWEEFNADGVRDRTHAPEKPEGVRRLVFLGDSVTLGDQLEANQAYPRVLDTGLQADGHPVEVFSVALWGWSTRQERIAYERIARKYRPDQVVLAVCLNDIPELQNNLSRPPRLLAALHDRSALVRRLVNAPAREIGSVEELFASPEPDKVRAGFERFFAEVRSVRDDVTRDGADFVLVVFPFRFQVAPGAPAPHAQRRIAAFCEGERMRCVDLLDTLAPAGEAAFVDYDHLSVAGSRLVAQALRRGGTLAIGTGARERLAAACGGSCPATQAWLDGRGPGASARVELLRLLDRDDEDARLAAAWALGRLADAAAVPALARLLEDPRESVRRAGARSLGALGDAARPAAPALFARLDDPRQGVRWEAARALSLQKLDARTALPPLIAALRSEDPYLNGFAAWSLGDLGPAAADAVPALTQALARDEGYGRGGASAALARIGPAAAAAVPALVEGLRHADGEKRWKAARTLGRIGPPAAGAGPALVEAAGDAHEYVRVHAVRALARVGVRSDAVADALARARRDRVAAVAKEARVASQELGLLAERPGASRRAALATGTAAAAALLAALVITPLVRGFARRRGWLDVPDGHLKRHAAAVPRIGGAAVFTAVVCGLAAAALPASARGHGGALLAAMAAVWLVGLADDLRGVRPAVKVAVQTAAAVALCVAVPPPDALALPWGGVFALGSLAWVATVLWLVGLSNAFNMIDGLDGLAPAAGCVSACALALIGLAAGASWAPLAGAMTGALLGFLRYNRSPASIFLGDSGSLSVGFGLAALALAAATGDSGEVTIAVPLLALALPVADAGLAIARRVRSGRPLFGADREHLHHQLLARGLEGRAVALGLVALQASCACVTWLLAVGWTRAAPWVLAAGLATLALGAWMLRPRGPLAAAAAEASRTG